MFGTKLTFSRTGLSDVLERLKKNEDNFALFPLDA